MPDLIQGVAVVDDRDPTSEILFIVCVAENQAKSKPFITRINIHAAGKTDPRNPSWQYQETGNLLAVTPSVRVSTTVPIEGSKENRVIELFHNAGAWTIPFVRWSKTDVPRGDDDSRWQFCHRLNAAILQPETLGFGVAGSG